MNLAFLKLRPFTVNHILDISKAGGSGSPISPCTLFGMLIMKISVSNITVESMGIGRPEQKKLQNKIMPSTDLMFVINTHIIH